MKKIIVIAMLGLASALTAFAGDAEKFNLIHIKDLAKLMKTKTPNLAIYDVNTESTRKLDGIIPGAKLLASSKSYDLAELPKAKDAKLVFYCANKQCLASHAAATRAIEAGYTDVSVMADGIKGWKKSGQPVAKR